MRQGLREKCRRVTAGVLTFVMVSMLALGDAGVAMASEYGDRFYQDESGVVDEDAYSDMVSTKAKFKNHTENGVTISVSVSDDSDFRAGGEVYLDVHVKNESNSTITEGILNFQGRKLKDSGAYFEELSEDSITEGIMANEREEEGAPFQEEDVELENDLTEASQENSEIPASAEENGNPENDAESEAGTSEGAAEAEEGIEESGSLEETQVENGSEEQEGNEAVSDGTSEEETFENPAAEEASGEETVGEAQMPTEGVAVPEQAPEEEISAPAEEIPAEGQEAAENAGGAIPSEMAAGPGMAEITSAVEIPEEAAENLAENGPSAGVVTKREAETLPREAAVSEEIKADSWESDDLEWFENEDGERRREIVAGDTQKRRKTSDEDEEEEDGPLQEITDLELAPGQIYSVRFVYTIDESLENAKNQKVVFRFSGKDQENKTISQHEMFYYTANYLNAGEVRFRDGNRVRTGDEVVMGIHTSVYDFDILLGDDEVQAELASRANAESASGNKGTPSNAQKATASNAETASPSHWEDTESYTDPDEEEEEDEEEVDTDDITVDLGNTSYKIEMINARLNGFKARKALVEDANDNMLICTYRVAKDVKPGIYFGKIIQESKVKGKTFKSSQGFALIVTGSGEVELTGGINGAEISVKGPVESFPDGDVLSLKVSEVPAEKKELVEAALEQKAQETGISVNKLRALDIKVISDGQEMELQGDVSVTFSNVELEPLEKFVGSAEAAKVSEETMTGAGAADEIGEIAEEKTVEEAAAEEEGGFSFFGLRRMGRRRAAAPEAETEGVAAENSEMSSAAENSGEGSDSEGESTIAVWHLDESAGVLNDMGGMVDGNGDVVMDTNHFSIFIVVDIGQLGGQIKLTVEHWATVETIDGDGTDASVLIKENATKLNASGGAIGYYTKDDVYDRVNAKIMSKYETGAIYESDEIVVPNKKKYEIEELSKICRVMEADRKNYVVKQILVSSNLSNASKKTEEWVEYKVYDVTTNANGDIIGVTAKINNAIETVTQIELKANSVIRFIYGERKLNIQYKDVVFYDHNISNGKKTAAEDEGTNTKQNFDFTKGSYQIGVGQKQSGNISKWSTETVSSGSLKGLNLNAGNYYEEIRAEGSNDRRLAKVIKGIVQSELGEGSKLQFSEGIIEPGFFENSIGTYIYTDYKLGFEQTGDTYRLSTVKHGSNVVLSELQNIRYTGQSWGAKTALYSNGFWPLDDLDYPQMDKWSASDPADGGGTHNWHFGMRYDFNFKVGDYIGPMNFYFRGDDDFWMFVDGQLVIDLGGIHSAEGQAINLKTWLEEQNGGTLDKNKVHRVSIFYMERGGFGSCCYMQFTLPNCEPITSPDNPQTTVTVKKQWDDFNNQNRPKKVDITLVQKYTDNEGKLVEIDKETKTLDRTNNWEYTWTQLPINDPNAKGPLTYMVAERSLPEGYHSEVIPDPSHSNTNENGYVWIVKNTLSPEVKVRVTKKWEDGGNKCQNRPDELKFQLYADGEVYQGEHGTLIMTAEKSHASDDTNVWIGEFKHLPKYKYKTDAEGNYEYKDVLDANGKPMKDQNGKNIQTLVEEEIVYTIKEVNDKGTVEVAIDEGGTLPGKHPGESYTVSYKKLSLTPEEKEDNVVAHTEVTNTHKHRLKVYKEWSDGNNTLPFIGLYEVEKSSVDNGEEEIKPVEGNVKQMQKAQDGKIYAEFNDLEPSKAYTVRELEECLEDDPEKAFSTGNNTETKYFKGIASEEYYQKYYQVSYIEPTPEITASGEPSHCSQAMTIRNELKTAKIRVAKWIDNWNEALDFNDLYDYTEEGKEIEGDEFTILIENHESGFQTGVVLKHAGNKNGNYESEKFSGYIEVPVGKDGTTYKIDEIIPMEYRKSLSSGENYVVYISHYQNQGPEEESSTGVKVNAESGTAEVTVMPGDDGLIVVHNTFEHEDYFHHDANAMNKFAKDEKPQSDNDSSTPKTVEFNGLVSEQRLDGKWDQPDDEEVRLV